MAKSNKLLQVISFSLIGLWVFIVGMVLTNEQVYAALVVPFVGN